MGTCCVFVLRMLFYNFCWRHKTVATSVSVIVRPSLWQNQKSIKVCNLWTAAELQRWYCSFGDFLTENWFLKTNYIDLLAETVCTIFLVRSNCARCRLWSDEFQTVMFNDRQLPVNFLDEFQTIVQTKLRSKCCPRLYAWTISAYIQLFKKIFPSIYDIK